MLWSRTMLFPFWPHWTCWKLYFPIFVKPSTGSDKSIKDTCASEDSSLFLCRSATVFYSYTNQDTMKEHRPLLRLMGHEYRDGGYDKAVLAVGSTEYHGDHLPYGTDTLVAEHLAAEASRRVRGLLMLPTIPVGMSAHYCSFPIAISLTTETLMHVLRDVFDSLRKHGLNRLLIVNGHDGNIPAIDAAAREYRAAHPEFKVAVLEAWWVAAGQLVPQGTFPVWGGLGHGGEGETSMMLPVAPRLG